jgi:hypothetical protein
MEISDRLDGPGSGIEKTPLGVEVKPLQATQLDVFTKTSALLLLSPNTSYIPLTEDAIFL